MAFSPKLSSKTRRALQPTLQQMGELFKVRTILIKKSGRTPEEMDYLHQSICKMSKIQMEPFWLAFSLADQKEACQYFNLHTVDKEFTMEYVPANGRASKLYIILQGAAHLTTRSQEVLSFSEGESFGKIALPPGLAALVPERLQESQRKLQREDQSGWLEALEATKQKREKIEDEQSLSLRFPAQTTFLTLSAKDIVELMTKIERKIARKKLLDMLGLGFLERYAKEKEHSAGKILFNQGDTSKGIVIIMQGECHLIYQNIAEDLDKEDCASVPKDGSKTKNSKKYQLILASGFVTELALQRMGTVSTKAILGDISVVLSEPQPYTVKTVGPVVAMHILEGRFKEELESRPGSKDAVLKSCEARLQWVKKRKRQMIEKVKLLTGYEGYLNRLGAALAGAPVEPVAYPFEGGMAMKTATKATNETQANYEGTCNQNRRNTLQTNTGGEISSTPHSASMPQFLKHSAVPDVGVWEKGDFTLLKSVNNDKVFEDRPDDEQPSMLDEAFPDPQNYMDLPVAFQFESSDGSTQNQASYSYSLFHGFEPHAMSRMGKMLDRTTSMERVSESRLQNHPIKEEISENNDEETPCGSPEQRSLFEDVSDNKEHHNSSQDLESNPFLTGVGNHLSLSSADTSLKTARHTALGGLIVSDQRTKFLSNLSNEMWRSKYDPLALAPSQNFDPVESLNPEFHKMMQSSSVGNLKRSLNPLLSNSSLPLGMSGSQQQFQQTERKTRMQKPRAVQLEVTPNGIRPDDLDFLMPFPTITNARNLHGRPLPSVSKVSGFKDSTKFRPQIAHQQVKEINKQSKILEAEKKKEIKDIIDIHFELLRKWPSPLPKNSVQQRL